MNDYGVAISLPFRFGIEQGVPDSSGKVPADMGGAVMTTSNHLIIWKDRVFTALFTGTQERVLMPYYGTEILSSLFESADEAVDVCRDAVANAFTTYLPDLTLLTTDVSFVETTGELTISVEYSLPDGIIDSLTFSTDTFNRYGDVIRKGL